MHRRSDEERVDFFLAYQLGGETPQNAEAEKCSELVWAKVSELLNDTIPYVRVAIQNFAKGQWFSSVRLGIGSRLVTCCSGASGRDVWAAVAERERLAGRQSSEHEPSSGGGYGRIRPSEPGLRIYRAGEFRPPHIQEDDRGHSRTGVARRRGYRASV